MEELGKDVAELNWARSDFEQRLGFRGGHFTAVNNVVTFLLAIVGAIVFYVIVSNGLAKFQFTMEYADMFLREKSLPIAISIVFLFY